MTPVYGIYHSNLLFHSNLVHSLSLLVSLFRQRRSSAAKSEDNRKGLRKRYSVSFKHSFIRIHSSLAFFLARAVSSLTVVIVILPVGPDWTRFFLSKVLLRSSSDVSESLSKLLSVTCFLFLCLMRTSGEGDLDVTVSFFLSLYGI